MATVTQLTTDPVSGNEFVTKTKFNKWAADFILSEPNPALNPPVYIMNAALLNALNGDFLGQADVVAASFYFGIENANNERVLLLTGTRDSGQDAFNANQVFYLQASSASALPLSTTAATARSWAEAYKTAIGGNYSALNPGAFVFNKGFFNNLRNQASVAMIKVVRGLDDNSNNNLILVAADASGNHLETATAQYQFLEKSRPCPPYAGCNSATDTNRSNHQF